MDKHQMYQQAVKELNWVAASIKIRKTRCEHLYYKAKSSKNPEQQEAYVEDLKRLRPKLLEVVQKYEELKQRIDNMPKINIA